MTKISLGYIIYELENNLQNITHLTLRTAAIISLLIFKKNQPI